MFDDVTSDGAIKNAISYDPLQEAENLVKDLTGKSVSYKDDELVASIGLLNQIDNVKRKEFLALATNDTLGRDLKEYLSVIDSLGFQLMLELDVKSEDQNNKFFIFAAKDGLVLTFDTYWNNKSINGGNLYFNCVSNRDMLVNIRSSGSIDAYDEKTNKVLNIDNEEYSKHVANNGLLLKSGSIDCREFVRYNVEHLRKSKLLKKWVKIPFIWLLHHMDTKCPKCYRDTEPYSGHKCWCDPVTPKYDYDAINLERIVLSKPLLREIVGYG